MREDGELFAGMWRENQRGRVVAAEFEFATQFVWLEIDAAFFDFQCADAALVQIRSKSPFFERKLVFDFEAA